MNQVKKKIRVSSVAMSVAEPPSVINKKGKDYVYFGDDNLYPNHLIDLYENSPTHGAIINGKVKYIVGRGLFSEDESVDIQLQRANRKESWGQVFKKVALDYELHNRFYIEVVKTKGGGKAYFHLDASRIRVDEEEQVWYYSDEWKKNGRRNSNPFITKLIRYDATRIKPLVGEDGIAFREIIPYDEYRPNFMSYAYPSYMNVLLAIETEKEICNYDLNQWKNGFLGATMINFNSGEPENDETKEEIESVVQSTVGGSSGKNILINYSDSKENAAEIVGVKGEDSAQEADMTAQRVLKTIFTGHCVTSPTLLGVPNASAFSNESEMLNAYELFKETYVINRQNTLTIAIEEVLGVEGVEIRELKEINEDLPISEIAPYLPKLEVRKLIRDKYGIEEPTEEIEPVQESAFNGKMSEEQEKVLSSCSKYGFSKQGFKEVAGMGCKFDNGKIEFADLNDIDLWILRILGTNPDFSATEIAEEAKLNKADFSISDIFIRLGTLNALGWVVRKGANYILSKIGKDEAKKEPLPEIELTTVYSYELRPDAPSLVVGGTSRPFCKEMVSLDRYYTKEDINGMSNDLGTNVWMTGGGYYTKKGTEISLPFCRHWWVQKVISKE